MTENRESPAGNSQIKLFRACPRMWFFKYILGFKSTGQAIPLDLGHAIHTAQEDYYTDGDLAKSLDLVNGILLKLGYNKDSTTYKRGAISISEWVESYGANDMDRGAVLETEKEYKLLLPNGYTMTVRLDSLMTDADGVYIRDTKTTGGNVSNVMRTYTFEPQPILYIEAFNQSNSPFKDLFYGWRTDVIASRVLKAGPVADCYRTPIVMPTDNRVKDILISYAHLTEQIAYAIMQYEQGTPFKVAFPCNPSSCYSYGRVCPHYGHCHRDDQPLPGDFKLDPWLGERTVLKTYDKLKEAIKEE